MKYYKLKDNRKWDVYLMQRENEKLMKTIKHYEGGHESIGPSSGENKNWKQKVY